MTNASAGSSFENTFNKYTVSAVHGLRNVANYAMRFACTVELTRAAGESIAGHSPKEEIAGFIFCGLMGFGTLASLKLTEEQFTSQVPSN